MTKTFVAKPIKVEAFQYGFETSPLWFMVAIRKRTIHLMPAKGHIVVKTEDGKINFYDPKTFNALFHSLEEAQDLNQDGVVDEREKAIATETENKKKRAPRKKKEVTE
ncbi:hypothetical protein PYDG_00101 [Pseudoalteromonas phage pYD6-A]|uniref:Uncharacterized protein n=1 Tax=Pseudoalteromonas phage pYD6-A TaxID=754052 RepID=M4SQP7_9CAUD|nr:hypothetical protein PYDG_00101 [Pseudoalteromonas phage pYD6-A]AGH57630.1 hypothetical protein PYDG_00101 [Pseudoalteromonas phage pYD6-A]